MVLPSDKLATAVDLADDERAEIIHGVIVPKDAPSGAHGRSQFNFGTILGRRFYRQPGGRWPGGWWFMTEAEVQHATHEVYLHDVAGWRRDRVAECPVERPILVRPDWVCELVSPSNARHDRIDKRQVLSANGVPHYWIADPVEHTLEVHRWTERGYLVVLMAVAGDVVRAEPFDAVELRVSALFGLEEDEE